MDKIKLHWTTKDRDAHGNGLGYSLHDRMMKKYSEPYFDYDENAQIALHIVAGDVFKPIPGRFNVLFTMWEFLDVPNSYIRSLNMADAIIVPCRFCKDIFKKYTNKPIYVCQEGIEPENFPFYDRKEHPTKKFRFLWVGAPNMRKGYPFILEAIKMFCRTPEIEVYIKTTIPRVDTAELMKNALNMCDEKVKAAEARTAERIEKGMKMDTITVLGEHENIIFDTRKIEIAGLRELYNSANCFILPTMGEGWGLTLCEAMATGAPCIATNITGVQEYFNSEVGFEIQHSIQEIDLAEQYGIKARSYVPIMQDVVNNMAAVMRFYPVALHKGKKASERIHKKFTWTRSGQRLFDIINELQAEFVTKGKENALTGRR